MAVGNNQTKNDQHLGNKNNSASTSALNQIISTATGTAISSQQQEDSTATTMPGWVILLIVVACIVLLISIVLGIYFGTRKMRQRRKTHGEYKPQQVEHLQAKDLPYITPPNIEGLM